MVIDTVEQLKCIFHKNLQSIDINCQIAIDAISPKQQKIDDRTKNKAKNNKYVPMLQI